MSNLATEFDSPWKEIIENYFSDLLVFFFPALHEAIDWRYPPEFLDKELKKIVRTAKLGKRLADKLVKVFLKNGEETWILIHLEIQSQLDANFPERMFIYYYRIYDRYRRWPVSLAILADENLQWRPQNFGHDLFGCQINFQFPIVKLRDYEQRWEELENEPNPLAIVVMAHLKAMQTRKQPQARKRWKFSLIKLLYEQGRDREDIINLFAFIDWVMNLPAELERELQEDLSEYEGEKQMRYVTSIERFAEQRGREQGRVEGIQETLLRAIALGLELKFGEAGTALIPEIEEIEEIERLEAIFSALKQPGIDSSEKVRAVYHEGT